MFETEFARLDDDAAGCGCAYPESVSDQAVEWSSSLIAVCPRGQPWCRGRSRFEPDGFADGGLSQLGNLKVAVVHGDHESFAAGSLLRISYRTPGKTGCASLCRLIAEPDRLQSHLFSGRRPAVPARICGDQQRLCGTRNIRANPAGIISALLCLCLAPRVSPFQGKLAPDRRAASSV